MSTEAIIALALLNHGPALARSLASLFYKKEVTLADWEAVFAVYKKPYDDYVKPIPTGTPGAGAP